MGLLKPTEGMTTMRERPTPETDALAGEWIACECVPVSHSRKLERERDGARAELTHVYRWIERNHPDGFIDSQSYLQNLERVTEHIHDKMDKREECETALMHEWNLTLRELRRLKAEVAQTLNENAHLTDGDNCTLIRLKRAIGWANGQSAGTAD